MTDAIIVALITASASVICQIIISAKSKKETEVKQAVRDKEFEDKLKRIEERLDEHNNYAERYNQYAERFSDVAISLAKMSKDIEYLKEARS